ncbi:MAG: alpha/beta hydrolase [Patescibacteria group bacterium]|jgi:pimeloyl-ACP methyl ester carboxylesterase
MNKSLLIKFRGRETHASYMAYGDADKPQILCLHGIGSTGSESYEKISTFLTEKFQLIAPDWIGYGASDRPLGKNDTYDADYCTDWLVSFVQTVQRAGVLHNTFHILAHSMSAIAVAKSYGILGQLINKIVIINPAGLDTKISKPFSFALTTRLINQHHLAKLVLFKPIWYWILRWSDKHRRRMIDGLENGELEVLVRYAKAGINPNGTMRPSHHIPDVFSQIQRPTMLICSEKDHIFYRQAYRSFGARHNWTTKVMPYKNHYLLTRDAEQVAYVINDFLQTA